jgi:ppGpp synthetase/RelA/SpoT-type nucleotidyltranferase
MSVDGSSTDGFDSAFDLDAHVARAIEDYRRRHSLYRDFADCLRSILRDAITIKVLSVDARAKTVDSFAAKVAASSASDPSQPKYHDPLTEVTDLAGVRVITFFPRGLEDVDRAIRRQFDVMEKDNKSDALNQEGRFGYNSVHYLVKLQRDRCALPELSRYTGLTGEIQVRTVLQHAWAEIEHDIQYKSPEAIPSAIRRRFMFLAGMLEIADREFQAIQDDDQRLKSAARQSIAEGRLNEVEIGPDALKAYLDRRLGPDGRMVESNYEEWVAVLRSLGFSSLQQVDDAIKDLDDRAISRVVWGARQGQGTRFEGLLLAAMGVNYLERHPQRHLDWFVAVRHRWLERLDEAGQVGAYRP